MSLSDRAIIEKCLAQDFSFAYIAEKLHRPASTILREVKTRRCRIIADRYTKNDCLNYPSCLKRNLCETETKHSCYGRCKLCTEYNCHNLCDSYVSSHCPLLDKAPMYASIATRKSLAKNLMLTIPHNAHMLHIRKNFAIVARGFTLLQKSYWSSTNYYRP